MASAYASGRSALVGTYVAEEVERGAYDLMAVSQTDMKRSGGGSPSKSASNHRRKIRDASSVKCTVLPALVSIDSLLQYSEEDKGAQTKRLTAELKEARTQQKEARVQAQVEKIRMTSARLYRGESSWDVSSSSKQPYSQRGPRRGTPSDEEVVRYLTQPLGWFKKSMVDSESAVSLSSRSSKRHKRREDYSEVFRDGFRGTELEYTPDRPQPKTHSPKRKQKKRGQWDTFSLTLATEHRVLPEDPVEAYFQMERAALHLKQRSMEESQRESNSGCLPPIAGAHDSPPADCSKQEPTKRSSLKHGPGDPPPSREAAPRGANAFWNGLLEQVLPGQKISASRREACQMLRLFCFGQVGNESVRNTKDKEHIFTEAIGVREQMKLLLDAWDRMDLDCSGRVDTQEFRGFADRIIGEAVAYNAKENKFEELGFHRGVSGHHLTVEKGGVAQLSAWLTSNSAEDRIKFATKMCERVSSVLLSGRKQNFCIEDLMRFIWPCSSINDLKAMRQWCEEVALSRDKWRASTPTVMPPDEIEALKAVFMHFDQDASGTVSSEELISAGLLEKDSALKFLAQVDSDGSGEIDIFEFCELMCPSGFRRSDDSETGSTPDGKRILYDHGLKCWRLIDKEQRSGFGKDTGM
mmetsp:Transcript_51521/g.83583  ORF Transcript_51521/g.83583 Transcript_51521/m.83583 type:complete len:638 (-) Transcript_51521:95-2008(-)